MATYVQVYTKFTELGYVNCMEKWQHLSEKRDDIKTYAQEVVTTVG